MFSFQKIPMVPSSQKLCQNIKQNQRNASRHQNSGKLDKNQSTLGSSSTILHPINEVRGRKNCSNRQKPECLDRSSNISQDKILKHQIRGRSASGY